MNRALRHGLFDNVVIGPNPDETPLYAGGLLNPGKYPRYCRHYRRGKPYNINIHLDAAKLPQLASDGGAPFVYGGVYQDHFGHSIAEFMHRLWILEQGPYRDCTVLFVAKEKHLPVAGYFKDVMDYFGVKKWRILTEPHTVDRLIIAEQGKTLKRRSHPEYVRFLSRRAQKNQLFEGTYPEKIALMRGHMQSRRFLGEKHLENYLQQDGYRIFQPEKHPIDHQLRTIANARQIIVSDGSACHLFDLLPEIDAEVAFLARNRRATIGKTSLKAKVKKLACFKNARLLFVPNNLDGVPQKSRGLLYAPLGEIVSFLSGNGFISEDAPDIVEPLYFEDMKNYLTKRPGGLVGAKTLEDASIELLAKSVYSAKAAGFLSSWR